MVLNYYLTKCHFTWYINILYVIKIYIFRVLAKIQLSTCLLLMVLFSLSNVSSIRVFFFDTFSSFQYIARRRGETFVRVTLIDVLPDIRKSPSTEGNWRTDIINHNCFYPIVVIFIFIPFFILDIFLSIFQKCRDWVKLVFCVLIHCIYKVKKVGE